MKMIILTVLIAGLNAANATKVESKKDSGRKVAYVSNKGEFICKSSYEDGHDQVFNFNVKFFLTATCDLEKPFAVFTAFPNSKDPNKDQLMVCCTHK